MNKTHLAVLEERINQLEKRLAEKLDRILEDVRDQQTEIQKFRAFRIRVTVIGSLIALVLSSPQLVQAVQILLNSNG